MKPNETACKILYEAVYYFLKNIVPQMKLQQEDVQLPGYTKILSPDAKAAETTSQTLGLHALVNVVRPRCEHRGCRECISSLGKTLNTKY